MNKSREVSEIANDYTDMETKKFIRFMCSKCKFYENESCSKKRIIRECARKGLKDKEWYIMELS